MNVVALLDRLDRLRSPDAIAEYFAGLGCTGELGYNDRCPLARFLSAETGRLVRAGSDSAWRGGDEEWWEPVPLPRRVCQFVEGFDAGCYPHLVEDVSLDELFALAQTEGVS